MNGGSTRVGNVVLARFAWREVRWNRATTIIATAMLFVAGVAASVGTSVWLRSIAPGSSVALSSEESDPLGHAVGTVDVHAVQFMAIIALAGIAMAVVLVVPAFMTGFHRQIRQVGLLSAVGASPGQLLLMRLVPAAAIGALGAVPGVALGTAWGLAWSGGFHSASSEEARWPVAGAFVLALLLVGVAVACALYPAVMASRVPSTEALRGRIGAPPPRPGTVAWAALVAGTALAPLAIWMVGRAVETASTWNLQAGGAIGVASMICWAVVLVLAMARVGSSGPVAIAYPMRWVSRHVLQTAPGAAAGALVMAAIMAGAGYSTVVMSSEVARYAGIGPVGTVFVGLGADAEDADRDAMIARVSDAAAAAGADVERVDVVAGSEGWATETAGGVLAPLDAAPSALAGGSILVVDAGVADALALSEEVRQSLEDGTAVLRASEAPAVVDGTWTIVGGGEESLTWTVAANALAPDNAPASAMVSPALASSLGWTVRANGAILTGAALTYEHLDAITSAVPGSWAMVEAGAPALDARPVQMALIGIAFGAVVGVLVLLGLLMREEGREDARILDAVGAGPTFVRVSMAAQAYVQTLAASLVGVPVGVVVVTRLVALSGVVGDGGRVDLVPLWIPAVLCVAVLPLVVAGVMGVVSPHSWKGVRA